MCKIRSLRERKNIARLDLHHNAQVEAFYYAKETSEPISVSIRVWTKWDALGIPANATSDGFSERLEVVPKILFLRDQVPTPLSNSLVVVASDEIYRVVSNEAPDGLTITSMVARLLPTDRLIGKLAAPT